MSIEKDIQNYKKALENIISRGGSPKDKIYRDTAAKLELAERVQRVQQAESQRQGVVNSMLDLSHQKNLAHINRHTDEEKALREQLAQKVRELQSVDLQAGLGGQGE